MSGAHRGTAPRGRDRRAAACLWGAGAAFALTALLYAVATGLPAARRLDARVRAPKVVGDWRWGDIANPRFEDAANAGIAAVCVLALLVVLARRRWVLAAAVAGLMVTGFGVAAVLAHLLGAWDPFGGEALRQTTGGFPSGHASGAAIACLALVIAVPPRARVATGGLAGPASAAVAVGMVALGWHYPSDIAAGFLAMLALCLAFLAAGPGRTQLRRTGGGWGAGAATALVGVTAGGAAAVWGLPRPRSRR